MQVTANTENPALRVAIDGPAASGKSAVGSAVAARLGCPFVDTGAMYRAFTWLALQKNIDPADLAGIVNLVDNLDLRLVLSRSGSTNSVHVDGLDASQHLRDEPVEQNVSRFSAIPEVRERMVAIQRLVAPARVVMAGRDIGTVVLPDAQLKVYLDASAEERARRRTLELLATNQTPDHEAILQQMRARDAIDSGRAVAPLRPAKDAVVLATDGISLDEVIEQVARLAMALQAGKARTPARGVDA